MAHIYWELHEIPRPKGSYINHSDGRVFLMSNEGSGKARRKVIGRATSETMMHPNSGRPVTYQINNGGMVDSKAFQKIVVILKDVGISVEGVILDRGFCTHDVVSAVKDSGYPYVLMLKSDTYGHAQMLKEHADDIRWKVKGKIRRICFLSSRRRSLSDGNRNYQYFAGTRDCADFAGGVYDCILCYFL